MTYNWYESYRAAALETDKLKINEQLLFAEHEIVARLRGLSQDHGGTAEERQAIANALNAIKTLRTETAQWKRGSGSDMP